MVIIKHMKIVYDTSKSNHIVTVLEVLGAQLILNEQWSLKGHLLHTTDSIGKELMTQGRCSVYLIHTLAAENALMSKYNGHQ